MGTNPLHLRSLGMTNSTRFGAIDAGVVLAGLSLLSQLFNRGREGYHTLEKQGVAPPAWVLPIIGLGAAAATIIALNPERIFSRVAGLFSATPKRTVRARSKGRAQLANKPKSRAKKSTAKPRARAATNRSSANHSVRH